MRISAFGALLKSNLMFAADAHQPASRLTTACWVAVPPINRTRRVDPFIHALNRGEIAADGPPPGPGARTVRGGLIRSLGRMRSKHTFGLFAAISRPSLSIL